MAEITIDDFNGIKILRDDLLKGGTKSILTYSMIWDERNNGKEFVYASPVYGGFQISMAANLGERAVIFCAKRAVKHPNTLKCIEYGAKVVEVEHGYLSVVEKAAKLYCEQNKYAVKLEFGAKTDYFKHILKQRVTEVIKTIGGEPSEIWCAIGSGTLVECILAATTKAKVHGVQVGMEYNNDNERLTIHKYHKKFEQKSNYYLPFPSMPNYDLKAIEYCFKFKKSDNVLFWNVM